MSLLELLLMQVQTVQMICDQQFSNAENMDENLLMVGRRRLPPSECSLATLGSSTWCGECKHYVPLKQFDLRLDLSRVPCSCNVIGYYAAVQDWTRKYSPGKVAAVGPTLCVSSIRIVLQHGLGSVGSREFQRMSPQKWYFQ